MSFLSSPDEYAKIWGNMTSAAPARAIAASPTPWQASATQVALVCYTVKIACTISLTTGQSGSVFLEACANSAFSSGVIALSSCENTNTGSLTLGLNLIQTLAIPLFGMVPIGYYLRLRSVNNTGSPTYTLIAAQETLL